MKNREYYYTLGVVLYSLIVSFWVYLGYISIYSYSMYNYNSFITQYSHGVYKYRVLSKELLLFIYQTIKDIGINPPLERLSLLLDNPDQQLYLSHIIINTIFSLLFAYTIAKIFLGKEKYRKINFLLSLLIISVVGYSQYVLTFYDISAYFFIALGYYISCKTINNKTWLWQLLFCLLIVISTLNRETSLLSIALHTALVYYYTPMPWQNRLKETIKKSLLPSLCFCLSYISLRLLFSDGIVTHDVILFTSNFLEIKNIISLLGVLIIYYLLFLFTSKKSRSNILLFHILSTPYIFMIFWVGIIYEIRLFIPLLLGTVFIIQSQNNILKK